MLRGMENIAVSPVCGSIDRTIIESARMPTRPTPASLPSSRTVTLSWSWNGGGVVVVVVGAVVVVVSVVVVAAVVPGTVVVGAAVVSITLVVVTWPGSLEKS